MPLTEALAELEAIVEAAGEQPPQSLLDANTAAMRECVICQDDDRQVRFTCGHCVA